MLEENGGVTFGQYYSTQIEAVHSVMADKHFKKTYLRLMNCKTFLKLGFIEVERSGDL